MKRICLLMPRVHVPALLLAFGIVVALAAPETAAQVAVEELWSRNYNSGPGISLDRAVGVVVDPRGDVIVTGQIDDVDRIFDFFSDFYTVKYSGSDGSVLWQRRFNRSIESYDYPTAIAVDERGDVVVAGHGPNAYTAKYAGANGQVLWEQYVWDGSVQIEAMALDAKGNVIVAGNGYVAKYAADNGSALWEQAYGGAATAVAVDWHGDVAVTGNRSTALTGYDYCTAKYSGKSGSLLWERTYNGPGNGQDNAAALAVDSRGDVVVTGDSENADPGTNYRSDYYTVKYGSRNGRVIWEHRQNGSGNFNDFARSIAVDGDDNVIVTGDLYSTNYFPHFFTAKYAGRDGSLLWGTYIAGVNDFGGDASAVAVDRSGNVVVTGTLYNGVASGFYTAEYSGLDGTFRWGKHFIGPGTWWNVRLTRQSLALGPGGVVAVSGSTGLERNLDWDFTTVLYRREVPR